MTVEEARDAYAYYAAMATYAPCDCGWCEDRPRAEVETFWSLQADAASIALDHAVATDVARRSVAY